MTALEIRPLNWRDDAELAEWLAVGTRSYAVNAPWHVPSTLELHRRQLERPQLGSERHDLVALVDGRQVGQALASWSTENNLTSAYLHVDVDPPARRRGYGTALVEALEALVPAERTTLMAAAELGPGDDGETRFAERLGYRVNERSADRHLPWPVAEEQLDALTRPTPGYRVETYLDELPEHLIQPYIDLGALIAVDSPSGDVEFEPFTITVEEYKEYCRRDAADGRRGLTTFALTAAGEPVGLTDLAIGPVPGRPVVQMGTYVRRDHRGHGLGMAIKVANLRALLRLPGVDAPFVRTGNANANDAMVRINEAIGFRLALAVDEYVKRR